MSLENERASDPLHILKARRRFASEWRALVIWRLAGVLPLLLTPLTGVPRS